MVKYVSAYTSSKDGIEEVDKECCAQLISSLCKSGLHAPALDFDFPIRATHETRILKFEKDVLQKEYFDLLDILVELGITSEKFRSDMQNANMHTHFAGCDCTMTYPLLEFAAEFKLVGSSTSGHFHLYIKKEMPWKQYVKLLTAFYKANLIQKNFYQISIEDQMSLLFKPGIKKDKIKAKKINID